MAESWVVAGVALTVLSDAAALRSRILDSARTGSRCPATNAALTDPGVRPDPGPGGLGTVGGIESVTVCRYTIREPLTPTESRVLSASQLTGQPAQAMVRARSQEVFVRYSGCAGHGIDDGHTQRQVTADVLQPLLSGPHRPAGLSGPIAELVWPQ